MTDLLYLRIKVVYQLDDERARQEKKFPGQKLPNGSDQEAYAEFAELAKEDNAERVLKGTIAWEDVLIEEVYEALAESDPEKLRAELIQVAAVCLRWIDQLDEGGAK